jgi:hypothetical protein
MTERKEFKIDLSKREAEKLAGLLELGMILNSWADRVFCAEYNSGSSGHFMRMQLFGDFIQDEIGKQIGTKKQDMGMGERNFLLWLDDVIQMTIDEKDTKFESKKGGAK